MGLMSAGAEVIDVGVGPTPLLYFAVHHLDADAGVMVTGSHNPGHENGLKMMKGKASFFGDDIRRLRQSVEQAGASSETPTGTLRQLDVSEAYVSRLCEGIDLSGSGLRVVIDAGNGLAGPLGLAAMRRAGLEPEALYCDMDGTFPNHHPDPTVVENLTTLIDRVTSSKASVGIAWDGDGDRVGAID